MSEPQGSDTHIKFTGQVGSAKVAFTPKPVTAWGSQSSVFDRPDERYIGRSLAGSLLIHGALFLGLILFFAVRQVETKVETVDKPDLVYLEQPGPGGGGGGSPTPAPAKALEIPKPKAVEPTPVPTPVPIPVPVPEPVLTAPVMTNLANVLQAAGQSSISLAAYGGGGSGGGIGKGTGNGIGEGTGGGFGGGAYHPGNGCVNPSPIKSQDPKYTSDAMRAKLQGDVELDVVVLKNGTVGDVRVTKSLDTQFGLDKEAIAAAKQWVFRPATCQGARVDMLVTLSIEFRLH
jgi:periplasmic protein TonB